MYKDYYKEIFQTSKSVIIPGLGSFSKTGPDDPKTTFNPYLKFNDGFLAGFIAKKQGISMDDAGKMIADNVEKINDALDKKGEAIVMGLGTLKKTADGKLEFISDADAGGQTPPVIKAADQPKPEIKPEKKPEIKPNEPEKKPEIKPVEPKPGPKPEIKPEKEKPLVPGKENPKSENKNPQVKVDAPGLTNVQPPVKDAKVKKEKEKKVKPPKPPRPEGEKGKKKFPVVLVIILVLLAGGATFTALKWDMVKGWLHMNGETAKTGKKEMPEPKKEESQVEQPAPDTTTAAETTEEPATTEEVKSEPVQEKHLAKTEEHKVVKESVQHQYTSSGSFHVIVNCFSMEQNANRMVEKLNAEGHQGNNLGLRGGFYMVEAGSFSTMEEAKSKLDALKTVYPKAWIYAGS